MVDVIQEVKKVRTASAQSEGVKHCKNLEHCLHWLHLEPLTHLQYIHSRRMPTHPVANSVASLCGYD
jgi:hypothetical protein